MYCYGFVLKSAFFLTLASLICIACSEYQILRSKLGKKRIGPGKKYHGQKSKHVGSEVCFGICMVCASCLLFSL